MKQTLEASSFFPGNLTTKFTRRAVIVILYLKNDALETSESIMGRISHKVIRKTGCLNFLQKVSLCDSREMYLKKDIILEAICDEI